MARDYYMQFKSLRSDASTCHLALDGDDLHFYRTSSGIQYHADTNDSSRPTALVGDGQLRSKLELADTESLCFYSLCYGRCTLNNAG
jgi:hypothetical protein